MTALDTTVGRFSASGRFRVTTEATPAGALARIGMSVSATGGGATSSAALFLDALAGGQSRVVIEADQFAVVNGSTTKFPLVYSGGVLRLRDIVLQNADIANLNVDWAKITNVEMTSALIGYLTVKTSNLDFSAITSWGTGDTGGKIGLSQAGTYLPLFTIDLLNPNPNPVFVSIDFTIEALHTGTGTGAHTTTIRIVRGSTILFSREVSRSSAGTSTLTETIMFFDPDTAWAGGTRTYTIQGRRSNSNTNGGGSVEAKVTLLTWKR